MAIPVPVTHRWTKLFVFVKIISIILCIGIVITLLELLGIEHWAIVLPLIFATIICHAIFINPIYHILTTYLYVRVDLGTKISFKEAKDLRILFEPNKSGVWYPMKEIKQLPKEFRREALFTRFVQILKEMHGT